VFWSVYINLSTSIFSLIWIIEGFYFHTPHITNKGKNTSKARSDALIKAFEPLHITLTSDKQYDKAIKDFMSDK
jgi:hypothetical protein